MAAVLAPVVRSDRGWFQERHDALGWKLEVVSYDTDAAAAFQQALDLEVDYVASTGTSQAILQDQIDAAKAAGIGYFSCFDTSEPRPGREQHLDAVR